MVGRAAQRRRLACLALIAMAGRRGISRDKLLALLWPERDGQTARRLLADTIWVLRSALGRNALVAVADCVALDSELVECDVVVFEAALARGDRAAAVAAYAGPFLDGFHISDAPEFERWVDVERNRLEVLFAGTLESLARAAEDCGERGAAVSWWRQLAAHRPYDSAIARKVVEALVAAGDRAGAIQHVHIHSEMLRELEIEPDRELLEQAEHLRAAAEQVPPEVVGERDGVAVRIDDREGHRTRIRKVAGPTAPAVMSTRGGRARRSAIRVAVAAGALIPVAWLALGRSAAGGLDADAILVAPFHVAADPTLEYLREGLVDLLATSLNGETGSRAVDPRSAIATWKKAGGQEDPVERGVALARNLGAGQVLLGGVIGSAQRLTLNATLYDVSRAAVRLRVSAEGPADSLPTMVDRLVGQILARDAGAPRYQLEGLTTRSLPALRSYLDGVRSYRRGRFSEAVELFEDALRQDSTFALAAIQLALAAGWGQLTAEPGTARRAIRLAWAERDRLSTPDRLLLEGFAGPRFPDRTPWHEWYAARMRAVDASPDRPEALFLVGAYHVGGVLRGEQDALARGSEYFRRAVELDSAYAAPLYNLVREAAVAGNAATVQRLTRQYLAIDSTSEVAQLFQWITAVTSGEKRAMLDVRGRMPAMHPTALGWISDHAVQFGVDLDGGAAALAALHASARSRRESDNYIARHWDHLGNRGRLRDLSRSLDSVARLSEALGPIAELGMSAEERARGQRAVHRIGRGLFWSGDTTGVGEALSLLEDVYRRPLGSGLDPFARLVVAESACFAGIARAHSADGDAARAAVGALQDLLDHPWDLPIRSSHGSCAVTLGALVAALDGDPDARTLAERADSVLRTDPPVRIVANRMHILLAQAFEKLGDPAMALRVIRRREPNNAAHFMATILREEGRLAAIVGDRDGAIRAYRHYLALRTDADPDQLAEVQSIREQLSALVAAQRR